MIRLGRGLILALTVMLFPGVSACGTETVAETSATDTAGEMEADLTSGASDSESETTQSALTSGTSDSEVETRQSGPETTESGGESRLETVQYTITYDGTEYEKEAVVYVPAGYSGDEPLNTLYLMHGSGGSADQMADTLKPLLDEWMESGEMQSCLVIFPTYYPDRSFVVTDYSRDYPLNHFFAADELLTLLRTVEGQYYTFAADTTDDGLAESRLHRAFGGYSMGGVTTWEVLAYESPYFAYYMPMAGDCWLGRGTDASGPETIADSLAAGLTNAGYTADNFRVIAMVGGADGTRGSMIPQIEALRSRHGDLFTDESLLYWENEGGGHSGESMVLEIQHGIRYLWTLS